MYQYNQEYREPSYEINNEFESEPEFEMGNAYSNSEFNYEMESDYEMAPGFEISEEMESDNEYGDQETNDEFNQQYEYDGEAEPEFESGSYKDEMEAELEYVTNEEEFSNWVNEVVVRDHRRNNLRPAMNRPVTRKAISHLSRIASRTLPFLGRRRGGWAGPIFRGRFNHPNRRGYGYFNRPGVMGIRPPWRGNIYGQPPYQGFDPQQQQPMNQGPESASAPAQASEQDGSFKNFVLDTIKNLSQQIAMGNESLAAIKSSMVNSAVNNFPAVVQPKTDDATAPPPAGPPTGAPQPEFEGDYEFEMETDGEVTDSESSFSEEAELELASALLSTENEMELDHFLGGLLKKAVGAVSGIFNSDQGNILKGMLKKVIKTALPIAGTAAGTFFGGPAGAMVGGNIGKAASNIFELELEGMSNEDREFEVARALVRLGGNAARQIMNHQTGSAPDDVRRAMAEAASRFAPGLLARNGHRHRHHHHKHIYGGYNNDSYANGVNNGTWYRKGNRIIIENI